MEQSSRGIAIVTDSSCDLPARLVERFSIVVIPLAVQLGSESFLDGELSPEAFWRKAAREGTSPQTSQPSIGVFQEVFERLAARGKRVLCLTLTGKHTGTVATARLAAERFGGAVHVFDSHSLSLGLGFQVLEAARASQVGSSMEEILALLRDVRARVHALVVLDTLDNVRRGGRADAFIAVVRRMSRWLDIKPIVNLVEGEVRLMAVARSLRRGIDRIAAMSEDLGPLDYLGVMHARNAKRAEELAEQLASQLRFPRDEILIGETGAVVASHAGTGAVGIFAIPKQPEENVGGAMS